MPVIHFKIYITVWAKSWISKNHSQNLGIILVGHKTYFIFTCKHCDDTLSCVYISSFLLTQPVFIKTEIHFESFYYFSASKLHHQILQNINRSSVRECNRISFTMWVHVPSLFLLAPSECKYGALLIGSNPTVIGWAYNLPSSRTKYEISIGSTFGWLILRSSFPIKIGRGLPEFQTQFGKNRLKTLELHCKPVSIVHAPKKA